MCFCIGGGGWTRQKCQNVYKLGMFFRHPGPVGASLTEPAGVVVGVWVEWWEGIGWGGGRGVVGWNGEEGTGGWVQE